MDSFRVRRSRRTLLPSIRISAWATRRTGNCRCNATCRFAATERHLSGHQGNAGSAGVSAQHLSTGAANPCPSCPPGFAYLTSNGNSSRQAGAVSIAAKTAQRAHLDSSDTLTRNPSMMIPPWVARELPCPRRSSASPFGGPGMRNASQLDDDGYGRLHPSHRPELARP